MKNHCKNTEMQINYPHFINNSTGAYHVSLKRCSNVLPFQQIKNVFVAFT